jgi:hypothetical protein
MGEPDIQLDRLGRQFDPSLHSVGADGKPRLTSTGNLRVKRGLGGDSGQQPMSGDGGEGLSPETRMAGVAAASTFFLMCGMFGGDDWKPTNPEREALQSTMAAALDYYGVQRVHPLVSLSAVILVYAQPRLMKPEARGAIARLIWRFKNRRAHANNRDNGLRQNDDGHTNLSGLRENGAQNPDIGPTA